VSHRSFLRIGGLTIAVRCDDDRIRTDWHEPVSRFVVDAAPADVDLEIRAADALRASDAPVVFDSGFVWRMLRHEDGYRIECRSEVFGEHPYKIATFDETFTRGVVTLRSDVLSLSPLDYPLDEVLMAHLLGRGRGVELHSCGVIDHHGRGRLFVGVSGAGKTTTARLWQDVASGIVSDDRVIVRERDGAMRMFGTPWHGEAELSLPSEVPLDEVYLLVQATENAIRTMPRAAAVASLFRCTFPPFYDASAVEFTLAFLEKLVDTVPVRELHFVRDRSVVDLVLREAA